MEDFRMELKAEASHIVKVLQKPECERMPFQGVEMAKSMNKIPFFMRFFNTKSEAFIALCISAQLAELKQGQTVYEVLEEQPEAIYLVLEGSVTVRSLPKACLDSETEKKLNENCVAEFGHFGETEVIFDLPQRRQSVVANSECKCMIIKADEIRSILAGNQQIQKCIHYFDVHSYFQDLDKFQKQSLVLKTQKSVFSKGTILISQGEPVDKLLFVINGCLTAVKEIPIKLRPTKLKINQITEMETSGEYEALNGIDSEVTLVAQNFGTYYWVQYRELRDSNHPILKMVREKALPYPSNEELQFIYNVQTQLKVEQAKVQKKILKNLANKKAAAKLK